MVESSPALRAALLGLLVLQTSATVLLLRYSRSHRVSGELYLATTAHWLPPATFLNFFEFFDFFFIH